jgi:hypothetical protein
MVELVIAIGANLLVGALAVLLIHRSVARKAQEPRLADAVAAMDLFRERFPEAAGGATLTADGRNALIDLRAESGIGLLQGHGARWNARVLQPQDLASVRVSGETTLSVKFTDYAGPRALLRLADRDECLAWRARLQGLRERGPQAEGWLRRA